MKSRQKSILLMVFALMVFGLIQVYSSSFIFAIENYGDGLVFFKKQLFFTALGFLAMLTVMKMPYKWIADFGWVLWVIASIALVLTYVPGIGVRVGGGSKVDTTSFGVSF